MATAFHTPTREPVAFGDTPGDRNWWNAPHAQGVGAVAQRRHCAFIFIANLPHLVEAYGLDFAMAVSREIKRRLCASFLTSVDTDLACLRDDCFLLWSNAAFAAGSADAAHPASEQLETLLGALGSEPIRAEGMAALVQLHADWIDVCAPEQLGASEIELTLWTAQPFPDAQESRTDGWRQLYRADMEVAVRVGEALQADRLAFAWRPVVNAYARATTFYREACPRIAPRFGQPASFTPEVFMPCLQRLGLTRLFDMRVVRQVIDALRRQPSAHMGVSIFAQSARLDHWWASMLSTLQSQPALASRLTVEISDGAAWSNLEAARNFCARLQSSGCRIAIKDFGLKTGNLAAVQACRPDIVKLDRSFLRQARESEFHRECLGAMRMFCAHLAPHVVVDGVEREEDVHVALDAGAQWLQGCHLRSAEEPARLVSRMSPRERSLA
ncbi:EAL domain-containing protein [Variovorax paradoxus]|nr:EAL domain-containing protein [Variovorax paradoxus]